MTGRMERLRKALLDFWDRRRNRALSNQPEPDSVSVPPEGVREVLFICTGNYYRSRFAEAVFNHNAIEAGLAWRAFSRGVAVHLAPNDLSPFTHEALESRGIDLQMTAPTRLGLMTEDLERAVRRIALKQAEHEAYIKKNFAEWEPHIEYWHIHDLDAAPPEEALPQVEQAVLKLLRELQREDFNSRRTGKGSRESS